MLLACSVDTPFTSTGPICLLALRVASRVLCGLGLTPSVWLLVKCMHPPHLLLWCVPRAAAHPGRKIRCSALERWGPTQTRNPEKDLPLLFSRALLLQGATLLVALRCRLFIQLSVAFLDASCHPECSKKCSPQNLFLVGVRSKQDANQSVTRKCDQLKPTDWRSKGA